MSSQTAFFSNVERIWLWMVIRAVRAAAGLFEEVIDQRLQGFVWLGRIEPGVIRWQAGQNQ